MASTTISAPPGVPFIDIEREFAAPRALVYRAYSEPELLRQWLGPRKYVMEVEAWEPRDGGRWRYVHRDGDNAYGFHGVFHGPQTEERMLQTFEFEGAPGHVSLEAVEFIDRGDRTLVRNHSVHQSVEARDAMVESGMAEGVEDGFARLEELVERLTAPAGSGR
ncbi:MAG TPA: SRPBCC family protein [Candidatus Limnocylindrales bacterium]|nr:SRPBCC family protein [Candidatus Limnocylindrales bacterium]